MKLNELLLNIDDWNKPRVHPIAKGGEFKISAIALKKQVSLAEHVTALPAKLIVIEGSIIYRTSSNDVLMTKLDEIEIEPNLPHSLIAVENSLCILIRANFE